MDAGDGESADAITKTHPDGTKDLIQLTIVEGRLPVSVDDLWHNVPMLCEEPELHRLLVIVHVLSFGRETEEKGKAHEGAGVEVNTQ